jgi:hypothetical protein
MNIVLVYKTTTMVTRVIMVLTVRANNRPITVTYSVKTIDYVVTIVAAHIIPLDTIFTYVLFAPIIPINVVLGDDFSTYVTNGEQVIVTILTVFIAYDDVRLVGVSLVNVTTVYTLKKGV